MDEEYSNRPPSSASGHRHRHPPASNSELMESAKLMAATAKSAVGGDTASINKAKVAEAAENLIGAAERYGKLEGSGIGSYLDKAEDYLHKYHDSPQSTAAHGENAAPQHRPQPHRRQEQDEEEEEEEPRHGGGGGGAGDYLQHRPQPHRRQERDEEEEEEPRHGGGGGGAGDYLKMAQGFFK